MSEKTLEIITLRPDAKHWSKSRDDKLDPTNPVLFLSPVMILVIWEIVGQLNLIDTRFFPPPSQIAVVFWQQIASGELFYHTGITLYRVLVGFAVGSIIGTFVGITMGLSSLARVTLYPLIAAIYPIPKVAIFPLLLLVMGLGEGAKLATIIASCFFFLTISGMSGVMNVPHVYKDVGRNFGANYWNFVTTIALPAALPPIFAGLRLSLGTAFLVGVSIEFISAQEGIGWMIWHSWELFSLPLMFVGLLTVSFLGLVLTFMLDFAEKRLVPWKS